LGLARFLAATLPSLRGLPGISPQGDNKDMEKKNKGKPAVTVFVLSCLRLKQNNTRIHFS
jgi:hypothetical protein